MTIIQQTEIVDKVSEHLEIAQKHIGKAMGCIAELDEGGMYGERNYGNSMWNRMGYREADQYEEMPPMMQRYGERGRRRDSMGRYM